jgi:hypothetical protein
MAKKVSLPSHNYGVVAFEKTPLNSKNEQGVKAQLLFEAPRGMVEVG